MYQKIENIIFMKYGVHASEDVELIIKRKIAEIQQCKKMFWGYGGVLCHPLNQVQPFLKSNALKNQKTHLVMTKTLSKLNNTPSAATMYSVDNINWCPIPNNVRVLGSKYAIVCNSITQCEFILDLADYVIPLGNCKGRRLSQYIQGRVDKACGYYQINTAKNISMPVIITLCAEIESPFSVFIK